MELTVSIVIVSRHRPAALRRCLIAISQLDYDPYEVVVVADPTCCTSLREVPQAAHAKLIPYDEANISAARNLGINAAAGEIIAFIDDDAVPEPTWLRFLIAPFAHKDTAAAGGYVRGRNGISWQYQARSVDRTGQTAPIELDRGQATILIPDEIRSIKTEGTNMAVRRQVFEDLGGFDPRFRFYLDETDLNLRLAERGLCTAIVPLAEVHHGFDASVRRGHDRVPRDLFEIGASWAVFLAKHCPQDERQKAWNTAQTTERKRVLAHMVSGGLEPRDVRRLMRGLRDGYAEGLTRQIESRQINPAPSESFRPNPPKHDIRSVVLSGRVWARKKLRRMARSESAAGSIVTLILLSPTALYHRVSFTGDGYWEQSGGLFGKSERNQKLISFWSFRRRVQSESFRVQIVRELG
jgi:GT2 family glycosyltransferase